MILLIAKNTVQEGKQQEFVELAKKMIENTRQEEGCIYYDLVADQNMNRYISLLKNTKTNRRWNITAAQIISRQLCRSWVH